MDASTTTTAGAAAPRVSAGQALAGVAVSVASSLLGTWVTTFFGEGTTPGMQLAGATAGALVPALVAIVLPTGRTHPVVALAVAAAALGLTYTGGVTRDIVTDNPGSTFPTPAEIAQGPGPDGEDGERVVDGLPHNVAIDNEAPTCNPAEDGTGAWLAYVTVDWYLPAGVERPESVLLQLTGEGWTGQREVTPGEEADTRETVEIRVGPPPDVGGSEARAVELTATIDPDGQWSEDDEGDNTVTVSCGIGGTELADANVTVSDEGASCSFRSSGILDLRVSVEWQLEGIHPSAQVELLAQDANGWSGTTTVPVGESFADLELLPTEGSTDVPTATTVTVTVDPAGALPESDEGDNQTAISCPR